MAPSSATRACATRARGFTLLELLVAMTVLGIILAIGIPSFRDTTANSALRSCTMDLVTAINTARAEAVNLRQQVDMDALSPGNASNEWGAGGWQLVYNKTGETKTFESCDGVFVDETNDITSATFEPDGTVASLNFQICDNRDNETGREISVNPIGRITNTDFSGCNS